MTRRDPPAEAPDCIELPNGYTLVRTDALHALLRELTITVRLAVEVAQRSGPSDEAIRPYVRAMELLAEAMRPERAPVPAFDRSRSTPQKALTP